MASENEVVIETASQANWLFGIPYSNRSMSKGKPIVFHALKAQGYRIEPVRNGVTDQAIQDPVDLQRRVAPRQKRSQERIEIIIDATKRLLERDEADSITTSTVAAEANVPVSSVYRYFPNIYSIHLTILEEFKAQTDGIIHGILSNPDIRDWRVSLTGMIQGLRELVQDTPSYGAVFRLTLTTPELRGVREEWNRRFAEVLAERWREGQDNFQGGDPDMVARMIVEIYCAAEVIAFEKRADPDMADRYFAESMRVLERYISPYLD